MIQRFCPHSHTEYSNVRLLDCINKPQDLIKRAAQIGLSGIAITDHECLGHAIKSYKIGQEIIKNYPNFKVALGNEIYLIDERKNNQKYFHFVLIAKDKQGFKQLRQLSSKAWMQSYWDRGMERVPTLKSELKEIIMREPGHLLATSACLGGELSSSVLEMEKARHIGDEATAAEKYNQIVSFMTFVDKLFGDDFYVEVAPAASKDQIIANNKLVQIAHVFNKKVVIGDDAHYLKREDRYIHKAYLNSKGGERETDAFYEYAYLQDENDLRKNLEPSVGIMVDEMCANSMEMFDKIEIYDLLHSQTIPSVPIKDYPKQESGWYSKDYPTLEDMYKSNDIYDRYWVHECLSEMTNKKLLTKEYWNELEEEARVKRIIGEKLGTNMFKYPITLKYYIDMMWECGSLVGVGRGSACAALNHYLLGITQLDPVEWNLPFFRYMNEERVELGDIDIDICPSKRPVIIKKIKEERGSRFNDDIDELSRKNLGCTLIATYGTEGTKSAILTACRGYRGQGSGYTTSGPTRDEEEWATIYHDGIDNDEAQYMASLIPVERGFLWSLHDVVYGNPDKGREPISLFINEVKQYPGLLDIMFGIEGLR